MRNKPITANGFQRRRALAAWPLALAAAFAWTGGAFAAGPNVQIAARGGASPAVDGELPTEDRPAAERIEELIRDLGSPRYAVRRGAANELRQIGAEAFDSLSAATDSSDPEVAASADYLLRQITVKWVVSDDSPAVRRAMRNFGNQPTNHRLASIQELVKLPRNEGIPALCRIARYDRSPLIARVAAMAVIRPDERDGKSNLVAPEAIDRELGESQRTAARWLRQYREQLRDPAAAVAGWRQLLDEELALLSRNSDETTNKIALGLMWNLTDIHRQLDNQPALIAMIDRMIQLDAEAIERTMVDVLLWLVEREAWTAVDEFLAKYDAEVARAKRSLYIAALARAKQGDAEQAAQLADRAAALEPQQMLELESFWIANELELRNQYEWAAREYRRVLEKQPVESQEAILSRVSLGNMEYDHAKYREAADALEPLVMAILSEGKFGQLYTEIRNDHLRKRELALPEREGVAAKLHHYRACQYQEEGDWLRARSELEDAIKFDETDADVLIQMYHLPEQDEKLRAKDKQRIRELAQKFQQEINESPNDPTNYNQWAWLISNTEGDFQQAVRYSHKSLDLLGPSASDSAQASFLDTLGRCYYAAGDLENAVKYQRQAVEKLDYMQVMHRQLALFEKELAKKQSTGKE